MRKNLSSFFIFLFLMIAAQNAETVYLQQEHDRLLRVANHESAIQNYINQNISSYSIQSTAMDKLMSRKHEDGSNLTLSELDAAIQIHKNNALRDLYFNQNPNIELDYKALPLNAATACANNGFENGDVSGFTFYSNPFDGSFGNSWSIYNNYPNTSVAPQVGSIITLVEKWPKDRYSGLPRVKDGNYAIKLNNGNNGNYDVSTMRREVAVGADQKYITFNYALVLQDPGHGNNLNPYYQCRIITSAGQVINIRTIVADRNNTSVFKIAEEDDAVYTEWICESIDVSQFRGQTVTLEVIVADCGLGGHWGYAYFDNFCGTKCSAPTFGSVTLDPMGITCPLFPLTVSGNFITPAGYKLANLTLTAKNSNNIVYTSPPGDYNISGDEFNFKVTGPQLFPAGAASAQFDFFVKAKFKVIGTDSYMEVDSQSANAGPDVTFINGTCKICNSCQSEVINIPLYGSCHGGINDYYCEFQQEINFSEVLGTTIGTYKIYNVQATNPNRNSVEIQNSGNVIPINTPSSCLIHWFWDDYSSEVPTDMTADIDYTDAGGNIRTRHLYFTATKSDGD